MREQGICKEVINCHQKFRKRLLLCIGTLLLVGILFFGTVLLLQVKVRYSYEELANYIHIVEKEHSVLLIEATPLLYPENSFEPSGWISQATEWETLAIDEKNGIQYCSVIVCCSAKRGEKWFGIPTAKTLYQERLSPHFPDDDANYKYQICICEVYYLEWELPGWELLTYGVPVLLWARELPDGIVPLSEPQTYCNPYVTVKAS